MNGLVPAGPAFTNLFMSGIIVASLYLARDIFIPVVLAVLLTFVLTPLVAFLQRWYVPRTLSVIGTVLLAVAIFVSLATMVITQVNQLATELPRYQTTLREKVQTLRDNLGSPGVFKNAIDLFNDLEKELDRPGSASRVTPEEAARDKKPLPVEIHQPSPSASGRLVIWLSPLVAPLTTTLVVLLFATFFLFQREDLRNRIVRLAGSGDIERTTAALNDAGQRLQRLFATQVLLNAIFGLVIGLGLWVIGVPNASLWGLLAMILRFVPYVGAVLCALLPILLAAAVGQDWSMVLWTILLFAVVEPLTGHVVEPLVYSHQTGVSAVAVVLAAVFWTWLWGPIGLLVSTPLTLCIVVLSRHVERLKFIDIMLGDQAPLTPPQILYQRMLAGDPVEAADHAARALKEISVFDYCDQILIGALKLAQVDLDRGRLATDRIADIRHCVDEILEDLTELDTKDATQEAKQQTASEDSAPTNIVRLADYASKIVALPGRGTLDRQAALVVAFVLSREGFATTVPEHSTPSLADFGNAVAICVCHLSPIQDSLVRYTVRRVRRTAATQPLIVVALGDHRDHPSRSAEWPQETTASTLETTIDAVRAAKLDKPTTKE